MEEKRQALGELQFQLDVLAVQIEHSRKAAFYSGYFSVGASFEVFSLTLAITGLLVEKGLPFYWIIIVAIYFITGVSFIAFSVAGFGRLKRMEVIQINQLRVKFGKE